MITVSTHSGEQTYDEAEAESPEAALRAAQVLLDELPAYQGIRREAFAAFTVDGVRVGTLPYVNRYAQEG